VTSSALPNDKPTGALNLTFQLANKSASFRQTNLGGNQSLSPTLPRSSGGAWRSKYLPSMASNFLISVSNSGGKSLRTW
jgi:hypothetical protein